MKRYVRDNNSDIQGLLIPGKKLKLKKYIYMYFLKAIPTGNFVMPRF